MSGWTLRPPQSFPAHFGRILREAVAHESHPVLFGSYRSRSEADAIAENWRHYRYCLREQPGFQPKLSEWESVYDLRLSRERSRFQDATWIILYLTAQPTKLSQFVNLNPHLSDLVMGTAEETIASARGS